MEPNEIPEFTNHMKEASEGGESVTRISLAISILAVLVAMITVLGHRCHTDAVLIQSKAGDQWSEYQAKKIREDNLSVVIDTLNLQPNHSPETTAKVAEYKAHIAKWNDDLAEEQKEARKLEAEVSRTERQGSRYDLGEALLQIAVVLCSITLLTRKRGYFLFGLGVGLGGLLAAVSAFLVH